MSVSIAQLPLPVQVPLYRIFIMGENDRYPTADFLEQLRLSSAKSHEKLMALFKQTSERGPPTNDKRKSRLIEPKRQIFELKTNDGNRVTWFYDVGRLIICTHALPKPNKKRFQQDIKNAAQSYDEYSAAKKAGTLVIIQ